MNGFDELQPLLLALRGLRPGERRAALITLTRTRGATFRSVGTRMLVHADGSTVCELSGGCPQHDILAHAREVIASGQARRVRYDAESGLDVLMEMGCGGELEVLVEPLDESSDLGWVGTLSDCLEQRRPCRLATLFARDGEVLSTRHAVLCGDDLLYDGIADTPLMDAMQGLAHGFPECPASVDIETPHGHHEVLFEHIPPPHALVVIGNSAAARALLPLALTLGWPTTLVDFDPERLRSAPVPPGIRALHAQPSGLLGAVSLDAATSVVVMTHNLQKDADYLAVLHGLPLTYVGLLGARGRVRRVLERAGLVDSEIRGPVGLDIGSRSPAEIALAIVAEILAVMRGRPGGPLRALDGTIH